MMNILEKLSSATKKSENEKTIHSLDAKYMIDIMHKE